MPKLAGFLSTVKLGIKELFNKEQICNSEPFPVTNLPIYLINSEQIGAESQCSTHIAFNQWSFSKKSAKACRVFKYHLKGQK